MNAKEYGQKMRDHLGPVLVEAGRRIKHEFMEASDASYLWMVFLDVEERPIATIRITGAKMKNPGQDVRAVCLLHGFIWGGAAASEMEAVKQSGASFAMGGNPILN